MKYMHKLSPTTHKLPLIIFAWLFTITLALTLATRSSPDIQFPYYQSDLRSKYSQLQSIPAHFDGIHYLRIASYGYEDIGTQAFFPLYPLLIRSLTPVFPSPLAASIFISVVSLIAALIGLYYLFPKHKLSAIISLLLFPTSFFLLSVYTESLFLAISVWFFVMLRKERWLTAAILAGLASSTRLVGIILAISLIIKYLSTKKNKLPLIPLAIIALSGFGLYSLYLNQQFGDPLMFMSVQSMFGAERTTDSLILLPQVIYRYLKMFLTVPFFSYLSSRIYFEFASFILVAYLIIKHWRTRDLALNSFLTLSIILPTLTGTLSSVPRYALVLIPFIFPVKKITSRYFYLAALVSLILLTYFTYHFATGLFVA